MAFVAWYNMRNSAHNETMRMCNKSFTTTFTPAFQGRINIVLDLFKANNHGSQA